MTSFINSIINRAIESTPVIQPRVRGKFERDMNSSSNFIPADSAETFQKNEQSPEMQDNRYVKENKISEAASGFATKLVGSVNPVISEHPVKTSLSLPSLISKMGNKENDSEQKAQQPEPDLKVIPPHPVSENLFFKNKTGDGPANNDADGLSIRMKKDILNPVKEFDTTNTGDGHYRIKQNKDERKLAASRVQPVVHPFNELYKSSSLLNTPANNNTPSGITFLKDDMNKRGTAYNGDYSKALESTQTINISIGRVEVKVSRPPVHEPPAPKKEGIAIMSLDEYLDKKIPGNK